ncbi:MAG TPA: zf-HC2 domain-containing protein [Polyangia bacterium]|jgi:anti-sigma factor RsiW|nr:zf-HC2 domain-containing protein [Polyangia bacterium]
MDHEQAQSNFSDYVDGSLAERVRAEVDAHLGSCIQCRTELTAFRNTVGSLGRLKQTAPPSFLVDIKQQIYKRSRGRFFRPRWKLFGRIPFEWVSLGTIIAMLVYYIAMLHASPSGVRPTP